MQPTTAEVVLLKIEIIRVLFVTDLHGEGTARAVTTARRWRKKIRRTALNRLQLLLPGWIVGGHGGFQTQCVRVSRAIENIVNRAMLNNFYRHTLRLHHRPCVLPRPDHV